MRCGLGRGAGKIALLSLLVATGACSPRGQKVAAPPDAVDKTEAASKGPLERAQQAIFQGDFTGAERYLQGASEGGQAEATLSLGELFLMTGRYEQVEALLADSTAPRADRMRAEALRRQGRLDEALSRLSQARPGAPLSEEFARSVLRGEIHVERGERKQAGELLLSLIAAANDGKLDSLSIAERARAWGYVGQAAHLLRSPEDANDAFNESESLAAADLELLLARAELFLEKYDFAHAEEVLSEAEKISPFHPEVREMRAHLLLKSMLAFAEVEDISREILQLNPKSSGARFLLAGVALRDLRIREAEDILAPGLAENPRDLDLLSMKAAVRFLAEDPEGFEAILSQVEQLSPGYVGVFHVVSEYAEWEHRYPDIEKLMRRAVRLDREDPESRNMLGLTLVRAGSDAAGVVELRRAFELDPYNVRVLNTLNLYEKTIPADYVESRHGPFQIRLPKAEAPLLERYVPALLAEAHRVMVERYDYTPQPPIGIEIYESRDQFAVRTSGLPQTAIAGVCFGRKLATMSPIASPGNLGMTLWHELAHVFHIGLSDHRVPRWLTEGFAEWETAQRDVGWSREMDLELYRALREGSLPELGSMSRAFTHARRLSDVANAYYASGKIAAWIADVYGKEMVPRLLGEFGKKKLPGDVVPPLLGASFEELDKRFKTSVQKDLTRFQKQFVSEAPPADPQRVKAALKKNPRDKKARFERALLELSSGALKPAEKEVDALLREDFDPQVAFLKARILLAQEKKDPARALIERMIKEGHDGVEVRMILGRLHLASATPLEAKSHLLRATEFDPRGAEAWTLLASLYHQLGESDQELLALREWAKLSEHDSLVHRRLLSVLVERARYDEAVEAGKWAVWVDLAGFDTHRSYGLALSRAGDLKQAEFEFESALLCPASPSDIEKLEATWAEELRRHGYAARAEQVKARVARSPKFTPKAR
jgi:cellulose synthase operon protein C